MFAGGGSARVRASRPASVSFFLFKVGRMKTLIRSFVRASAVVGLALVLMVGASVEAQAQTALTSTTLATSMTDTSGKTVALTSASGFTASSISAQTFILIDREVMYFQSLNSTNATVIRGMSGTRAQAHFAGATVYFIPGPTAVVNYMPSGYCVRTNFPYVPVIVTDMQDEANNGTTFDCLGSQWVSTNRMTGVPVIGATVASASSITATGTYFKVSGTTAVNTITVPAGWASGMSLIVEPLALGSTGTSGNILLGTAFVVGKALILTWNGQKWVPSY